MPGVAADQGERRRSTIEEWAAEQAQALIRNLSPQAWTDIVLLLGDPEAPDSQTPTMAA